MLQVVTSVEILITSEKIVQIKEKLQVPKGE
jgi:hypothetical protein